MVNVVKWNAVVKIVQKDWPPFVYVTVSNSKNNVLHEHCTMFNPNKLLFHKDLAFSMLLDDFEKVWKWMFEEKIDFDVEIETNDQCLYEMVNKIIDEMKKRYPPPKK